LSPNPARTVLPRHAVSDCCVVRILLHIDPSRVCVCVCGPTCFTHGVLAALGGLAHQLYRWVVQGLCVVVAVGGRRCHAVQQRAV